LNKHFFIIVFFASASFCQWPESDTTVSPSGGNEQSVTYIVKTGDNFWDIAFKFLGDPFRWPQLWKANAYIKNPNRIYPGNTLTISASGQPHGKQAGRQLVSETASAHGFVPSASLAEEPARQAGKQSAETPNRAYDSLLFTELHPHAFLTAETMERAAFLWFDKDPKGQIFPGCGVVDKKESGVMAAYAGDVYRQFDEIAVSVYGSKPFKTGDTVDIFHADRFIRFMGKTANIVRRIGRARILTAQSLQCTAVLFAAWDVVAAGDRVDTMTRFYSKEIDTIVGAQAHLCARILYRVEQTERPYLYHTFLCDRGSSSGVGFGDLFAVYGQSSVVNKQPEAIACVVNVGAHSSTLRIEKLYENTLETGDSLERIRQINFK